MRIQKAANFIFIVAYSFISLSCGKKSSDDIQTVVPSVKIADASQERTSSSSVMHFTVTLDKTTTVPVSVDYVFVDGSAKSPKDYSATPGTITIPANQSVVEVTVPINGDPTNTRQDNLDFTIQLTNPKACTISIASAKGTIITENGTNFTTDNTGFSTPLVRSGYTLIWGDEFSGSTLDANAWNYEQGNGNGGWGNNELEYYTNSTKNVFVSNGNLIIEARKETLNGFNYSSARITTQNKKNFTYGRIDIRAKLPKGKGVWPALWMLGSNINTVGWPSSGEIDIMELLGQDPAKVYGTLHFNTPNGHGQDGGNYVLPGGSFSDQFHVFSMEWKQDEIKLYVDENLYKTFTSTSIGANNYAFNHPFFFIFNVAVGGNWPGNPDATTSFPQRMIVDYVRVYQ